MTHAVEIAIRGRSIVATTQSRSYLQARAEAEERMVTECRRRAARRAADRAAIMTPGHLEQDQIMRSVKPAIPYCVTFLIIAAMVCCAFRYQGVPIGGTAGGDSDSGQTGAVVVDRWTGQYEFISGLHAPGPPTEPYAATDSRAGP